MNRYVIVALVVCLALAGGGAVPSQSPASALAAPVVLQVTPSRVYNTAASEVTIRGSGFVATGRYADPGRSGPDHAQPGQVH